MSRIFDSNVHTHITTTSGSGPYGILLVVSGRVWIAACHIDQIEGATQVGDGLTDGFDIDGNCILSVPFEDCMFHTDDEAMVISEYIAADAVLPQ